MPGTATIPRTFSTKSDGGGLRTELAGDLFGLAQNVKA
jgi:hypothetical protein